MTKARQLGLELARSPEIKAMHEAEMEMLRDPAAGAIVREFNEKRRTFEALAAAGREPEGRQKEEAAAIESKAQANPLIAKFFAAQKVVEELLEQVNEEIGAGLTGAVAGVGGAEEECEDCGLCKH